MKSKEIRKQFIDFFEKKNHKFVPSAPVVPVDDPTLLFTNAGMNQFKNIFLGVETREYTRAVNSQKCIRVSGKHNDLEEVGRDTYHHTFFEMLGNWSFGDYYKQDAISWAWELMTDVWKLPKDKLYASVYKNDREAENIWKEKTDINPEHVLRFGDKDNFWEMGDTGPCGPCSEIHIDLGPERCDRQGVPGHVCCVNGDCGRYIELWNLVFMQFNRQPDSSLVELKSKHVDTGMGFERIVSVLQEVSSNYDTDLFVPIIQKISEISRVKVEDTDGVSHQVIADHIRTLTFAITDGGLPSNEGRGYVLRRILRRAARFGRTLGLKDPFLYKLVPTVVDVMGDAFPELKEKYKFAATVIKAEEEGFNNTLDRGIELFEKLAAELISAGKKEIPGKEAFKLYDTYGFPLDLTELMAREKGISVDITGFETEMDAQRQRARNAGKWEYAIDKQLENWTQLTKGSDSNFIGYHQLSTETEIRGIKTTDKGTMLTLADTPFYAESGGQTGDAGQIVGENFTLTIVDTQKLGNQIVHFSNESVPVTGLNPRVVASVTTPTRLATARNHTATHLFQAAVRQILGDHVHQSGSMVTPERLRFDLTHFERITPDEISQIENLVNTKIREALPVKKSVMSFDDAKKSGAMALFGEKYGDEVRVIQIADFSKELCGGTHLDNTGQIGYFRIVSESSVAAGIRRIEAVTGEMAHELIQIERHILETLREMLNAQTEELPDRVNEVIQSRKQAEKQLQEVRTNAARGKIADLADTAIDFEDFKLAISTVEAENINEMKQMGDKLRQELKSGVGVLGAQINDKLNFVCIVTDDLVKGKKLSAGNIVKKVAQLTGGGGGGRPQMATAGGKDVNKLSMALKAVPQIIKEMLS